MDKDWLQIGQESGVCSAFGPVDDTLLDELHPYPKRRRNLEFGRQVLVDAGEGMANSSDIRDEVVPESVIALTGILQVRRDAKWFKFLAVPF